MTETAPLAGLRVLEIGTTVAAPYAGKILRELGAEVIKVENPDGGDTTRGWGEPMLGGKQAIFQALNKGKHSITVDLGDAAQRDAVAALACETCDVVLQNLRPGTAERVGLGPDDLLARNPRLVYCSIGAFGRRGPMRHQPGYDPLMQAFSGIASITGHPDRPPARVGSPIIDFGTGMWSVIGILALLQRRQATGRGGTVDTSLFETALGYLTGALVLYEGSGRVPQRSGLRGPYVAPNRAFEASDGLLMITCATDVLFARLCEAIERPELADDPRFASVPSRREHEADLGAEIDAAIATRSRAAWAEALDAAGVPNAPVHDLAEVIAHAQTIATGLMQPSPDGSFRLPGLPVSIDGERPPLDALAPELGADNQLLFDFMDTPPGRV